MKLTPAQSKKIRQSAKGERCALQIAGVCNNNPETVVWCHFTDESKGIGIKGFDLSGGYGCSDCHDAIDFRNGKGGADALIGSRDWYLRRAQTRTLKRLLEKGILKIT